jgi:ribonuclease HII
LSGDNELCASPFFDNQEKKDTFHFERTLIRSGYQCVAGLDEAGRGPLAGPVVAACVVLPPDCDYQRFKDSKQLTAAQRQVLFDHLHACGAKIGCAVVSAREIERINILQASLKAMGLAVKNLAEQFSAEPDFLLVDGTFFPPVNLPQRTLVKGESKSASIAAASIIAKVVRDRLMDEYHLRYPAYDFPQNKGYATSKHRGAIEKHGPCAIHRRTFKGVREHLENNTEDQAVSQPSLW